MSFVPTTDNLTPEQAQQAQRIQEQLQAVVNEEIETLACLMASKSADQLFGETEFEVRDIVHRIGAKALEISANEKAKKGLPGC